MVVFLGGESVNVRTPVVHFTGTGLRAAQPCVQSWLSNLYTVLIRGALFSASAWLVNLYE